MDNNQPPQLISNNPPVNTVIGSTDLGNREVSQKADEIEQLLHREEFRTRTLEIVKEHVGHTDFIDKVKKYAGEEIESRRLKGIWKILLQIFGFVVALALGYIYARITHTNPPSG